MSFITIPNSLIQVGKAVKREIFKLAKDNLDDHEGRITSLEGTSVGIEIFNSDVILSSNYNNLDGVAYYKAGFNFNINFAEIQIFDKDGISSGIVEIDVLKNDSPDDSGMVTIFSTRPSLDFSTANDYDVSTNQVINAPQAIVSGGDFLRLDITSLPSELRAFRVVLRGSL